MENSTNQELHRMTVRRQFYGVVITTFLGFSTYVLAADEAVDTDDPSTQDQSSEETAPDQELAVEPIQDQLSKNFLQELSKEEFKEYMLNWDEYSKNDQNALLLEYQRRCSDDSKDSSADLCPDDIEPTFGITDQESDSETDEQTMPQLVEQSVPARTTVRSNNIGEPSIERDPRIKNSKNKKNTKLPSWQNKPEKEDFSVLNL